MFKIVVTCSWTSIFYFFIFVYVTISFTYIVMFEPRRYISFPNFCVCYHFIHLHSSFNATTLMLLRSSFLCSSLLLLSGIFLLSLLCISRVIVNVFFNFTSSVGYFFPTSQFYCLTLFLALSFWPFDVCLLLSKMSIS